jgi:hypothetical protein
VSQPVRIARRATKSTDQMLRIRRPGPSHSPSPAYVAKPDIALAPMHHRPIHERPTPLGAVLSTVLQRPPMTARSEMEKVPQRRACFDPRRRSVRSTSMRCLWPPIPMRTNHPTNPTHLHSATARTVTIPGRPTAMRRTVPTTRTKHPRCNYDEEEAEDEGPFPRRLWPRPPTNDSSSRWRSESEHQRRHVPAVPPISPMPLVLLLSNPVAIPRLPPPTPPCTERSSTERIAIRTDCIVRCLRTNTHEISVHSLFAPYIFAHFTQPFHMSCIL